MTGADEQPEAPAQRWIRELLAEAPPLTEWQRDQLRPLLDLSEGHDCD